MKKFMKILAVIGCGIGLASVAYGNGAPVSFNVTNYWPAAMSLTSYPTNAAINGTNVSTGNKAVAVYNSEVISINVQGFLLNTNASAAATQGITFVTSDANGGNGTAPAIVLNAGGQMIQCDWQTTAQEAITVPLTANTTNWFNYQTNIVFNNFTIGSFPDANWLGIYQLTNNLGTACWMSNCTITANIKYIPHPLIGQ
jgi:hypothetical protein